MDDPKQHLNLYVKRSTVLAFVEMAERFGCIRGSRPSVSEFMDCIAKGIYVVSWADEVEEKEDA